MKPDEVSSIFWIACGVVVIYISYNLGLGTLTRPGPGFMIFWASVILCLLGVLVFIRSWIADPRKRTVAKLWLGSNWKKPALILFGVLVYGLIFEYIGYLISTTALLLLFFRAIDPVKWGKALFWAASSAFVSFVIFDLWLQVQLPHWEPEIFLFRMEKIIF